MQLLRSVLLLLLITQPLSLFAQRSHYLLNRDFRLHHMNCDLELSVDEINCLMSKACAAQNDGAYSSAIGLYEQVWEGAPCSDCAAEALFQAGRIYEFRCQFEKAFELYNKIVKGYPHFSGFNQVITQQFNIATFMMEGGRPHYFGVVPGMRDYRSTIRYFETVADNAPSHQYAPMALLNMGILANANCDAELAINAYDRLINEYPESNLIPTALEKLGDTFASMVKGPEYDQGATLDAAQNYETFLIVFPKHPEVACVKEKFDRMVDMFACSKQKMGDFYYYYRNNCTAATIFDNQTITIAPESNAACLAKGQLELIQCGILAPKTPIDHIFGRYKAPVPPNEETQVGIEDANICPVWDEKSPCEDPYERMEQDAECTKYDETFIEEDVAYVPPAELQGRDTVSPDEEPLNVSPDNSAEAVGNPNAAKKADNEKTTFSETTPQP